MLAALILIAILVGAGFIFYLHDRIAQRKAQERRYAGDDTAEAPPMLSRHSDDSPVCCGMHITCEKDSLSTTISSEIVYYDDEELDAFAGRQADSYDPHEEEQFRDVLLTLLPDDIAGWARSLQLRGIELPSAVKDELLLIVNEVRASRANSQP